MALKVKAVERKIKFTKDENNPGVWRYVMQPDLYIGAEPGEGDQGGSSPLRCKPECDEVPKRVYTFDCTSIL